MNELTRLLKSYGSLKDDPLTEAEVDEMVRLYDMPRNYHVLNPQSRKRERLRVLKAWFDPSDVQTLCNDVEKYIIAHRLWVDYYMKPAKCNEALYHLPDPRHKYDMLRAAMSPALSEGEPAKSVIAAPRGTTKTVTLILERYTLVASVRPHTRMGVTQINSERTMEVIGDIKEQFMENDRIHADCGGPGVLFPKIKGKGKKWNDKRLDFISTHCVIFAVSTRSAHRGRRLILGTIDDPEDNKLLREKAFRRRYFTWLLRTYMPQFKRGGVLTHICTICEPGSCTDLMLQGLSVSGDDAEAGGTHDERFDDWHKINLSLITQNPETGEEESVWEEYISVETFHNMKRTRGLAAVMAEYQGAPIAEGATTFERRKHEHGYMRCKGYDGDYMLDLKTGEEMPWDEFVKDLAVYGGCDLADSMSIENDPGAVCFVGIDPTGTKFVLDAWRRHTTADKLVVLAFQMASKWNTKVLVFEQAAMQTVVVRMAKRLRQELLEEGYVVPQTRGIKSTDVAKPQRILAILSGPMNRQEIRFPIHERLVIDDKVHEPAPNPSKRYLNMLLDELDGFTDEKQRAIDLLDALEMAMRTGERARGKLAPRTPRHKRVSLEKWRDAGVELNRSMVPVEAWPQSWIDEALTRDMKPEPVAMGAGEMDPYDGC